MIFLCTGNAGQESFDPPLSKAIGYAFVLVLVLGYAFMLGFAFAFAFSGAMASSAFKTILSCYKSVEVVDNIAFKPEFVPSMKKCEPSAHHEQFDSTPRISTFTDDTLEFGRPCSFEQKSFYDDKGINSFNLR